ncbi:unnamed protein product [Pseudo-nitzschia multistriata]|uniref:Uncharacterized protein n=1 Tax=Pseudo-nitzschia multistriata TaxID=183589 RepID=A0A448ZDV6_9STRA|nr:unnamed protein product [Pseudo-nitzschia multistriata]
MVARTGSWVSGALSMAQRNMAFGRLSKTTPSTSITSSFGFFTLVFFFFDSFPWALAAFFPNSAVVDIEQLAFSTTGVWTPWFTI